MVTRAVVGILALVAVAAAIAAALLHDRDPEHARRDAFISRCNEEGGGGMLTSRELCEEMYRQRQARKAPASSS